MAIEGPKATAAAPRQGPDGQGGLSWRARNGRNAQGKKARRRHCGRGGRGAAGLRPDQAMEEASRCARSTVGDKEMMAISHGPCTKAAQPSPMLPSSFSSHCPAPHPDRTNGWKALLACHARVRAQPREACHQALPCSRTRGLVPRSSRRRHRILDDMGNVAPLICSCLIGSCRSEPRVRGWTERMARLHWSV